MQDFIPKGNGNSRSLKSSIPNGTTWEQALEMLRNGTFPIDIGAANEAGVLQKGNPINKSTLLKDETAALFKDLPENPVPDEVFRILSKAALVNEAGSLLLPNGNTVKSVFIESGTYKGTGKWGKGNPNSLSFSGKPEIVFIFGYGLDSDGSGFRCVSIINGMHEMDLTNGFGFSSITWGEKSVSWYISRSSNGGPFQANQSGETYLYTGVIVR